MDFNLEQDNLLTLRELFRNWTLADYLLILDNPNQLNQTKTKQLTDQALRLLPPDDDSYYLLAKLYLEKSKAYNRYLEKQIKQIEKQFRL